MINDDYCDCMDGTDETKTSACSHRRAIYTCPNVGSESKIIPSSRFMDGICDCCDGTDEEEGICQDFCEEEGKQLKEKAISHFMNISQAWDERQNILRILQKERSVKDKEIATKETELKQLTSLIKTLEVLQLSEDKKERKEQIAIANGEEIENRERIHYPLVAQRIKEGKKSPVRRKTRKTRIQFEESELPAMLYVMETSVAYKKEVAEQEDGTEKIISHEVNLKEYMTYIADPQVQEQRKEHRNSIEEMRKRTLLGAIINNGPEGWWLGLQILLNILGISLIPVRAGLLLVNSSCWVFMKGLEILGDFVEYHFGDDRFADLVYEFQKDGVAALHPRLNYRRYSFLRSFRKRLKVIFEPFEWIWTALWDAPIQIYRYFMPKKDKTHKRPEAELLRKSIKQAKRQKKQVIKELEDITRERDGAFETDYGPERIFLGLEGQCYEEQSGEFEYEFCPFKSVKQDSMSIGKWGSWELIQVSSNNTQRKMLYVDGQRCYGGQIRHTDVILHCAHSSKILSVEEPEICYYEMVFATPLACDQQMLESAAERLKALGVDPKKLGRRPTKSEAANNLGTKDEL